MNKISVTIVVPIYNSETTLLEVFASLEKQDYPVEKVILIDNNSKDLSFQLSSDYAKSSKFIVKPIRHETDRGLSYSYNEAIRMTKTSHLITLQSDCVIKKNDGIRKLIEPFLENNRIVVSCSLQMTPWHIWNKYNFWQKCLFSRHVGKNLSGRNGRFCCFSIEALKKVSMFDEKVYRTAGEDGDILLKLSQIGEITDADVIIEHVHNRRANFSLKDYIYKENQLAEATGACLSRNFKMTSKKNLAVISIRPVLIFGLLIPIINIFLIFLIFLYSVLFTKYVFSKEWRDTKILILPFINIFLLFSYTYYFFKGLLMRQQRL